MVKIAPSGLGIFIAFGSMIKGGPKEIIRQCKELGATYVCPRLGEGPNNPNSSGRDHWYTPAIAKEFCKLAHENGMLVGPWAYNRHFTMDKEISLYEQALSEGADFIILDAEEGYRAKKPEAQIFVDKLKSKFPDIWIANMPYSFVAWHEATYPYKEFGQLDGAIDQCYWAEFNTQGAQKNIQKMDPMWAKFTKENPGTAIRGPCANSYGSELKNKWKMKQGPPGPITVEDVQYFLEHYKNLPFVSFYSLEAMDEKVYSFLKERNLAIQAKEINDITPTMPMILMPLGERPTPADSPDAKALENPNLPVVNITEDSETENTVIIRTRLPQSAKPEGIVVPQKPSIFEVIFAFLSQLLAAIFSKKN